MTPRVFILALFSMLFRWLRLFRVRALKLSRHAVEMIGYYSVTFVFGVRKKRQVHDEPRGHCRNVKGFRAKLSKILVLCFNFSPQLIQFLKNNSVSFVWPAHGSVLVYGAFQLVSDQSHCCIDSDFVSRHSSESASARARRQGTSVLDRPEKRQTLKLEFA